MNLRKKLFLIFTAVAIAFFAAGVIAIIVAEDKTFKEWFCIGMLVLCALFASIAGFVKPGKEEKK